MAKTTAKVKFTARLCRPVTDGKPVSWTFLLLPKAASGKLPSRSMTSVEGTLDGAAFQATLEPDGKGSHWLKVDRDWIHWITSGKRAETRVKRIQTACDMLAKGKRRACCFDRSGMYSKSLGCPEAADD
jgi:hypothetical protein